MQLFLIATFLFAEGTEPVGVPGWVPLVIAGILLLLFWWGLNRNSIPQGTPAHDESHESQPRDAPETDHSAQLHESVPAVAEEAAPVAQPAPEPAVEAMPERSKSIPLPDTAVEPDDLKQVEGIGPKIEGILHAAGIKTFADLAAASVSQLEKIVREDAGIRVAFPDTWPEQAGLASAGEWDRLEQLQENLKGGRRT